MLADVNSLMRNAVGWISDTRVKYDRKAVPVNTTTSLLARPLIKLVKMKKRENAKCPRLPALRDTQKAQYWMNPVESSEMQM